MVCYLFWFAGFLAEYVGLYVKYILNKSIYRQFAAFYHGFHSVCASNALIMLQPKEVEMLVCGSPHLDLDALEKVTKYEGYAKEDATVRYVVKMFRTLLVASSMHHVLLKKSWKCGEAFLSWFSLLKLWKSKMW